MKELTWGVVIVTFNPNWDTFIKKVKGLTNPKRSIVIVNNGEDVELKNEGFKLINLHENKGIAYAQNIGAKSLIKEKKDILFFFDQDSICNYEYFDDMLKVWGNIQVNDESIGMLSPIIIDKKFNYTQSVLVLNEEGIGKKIFDKQKVENIKNTLPISSGIAVSSKAYSDVKGLNDLFFIDYVDFEFDLNLIKNGYSIYSTNAVSILHSIGRKEKRKFFFKTIYPSNHPLFREYYFIRNGIIVYKMYGGEFKGLKKMIIRSFAIRSLSAFYEKNKFKRLQNLWRGLIAGVKLNKNNFL